MHGRKRADGTIWASQSKSRAQGSILHPLSIERLVVVYIWFHNVAGCVRAHLPGSA